MLQILETTNQCHVIRDWHYPDLDSENMLAPSDATGPVIRALDRSQHHVFV